MPPVRAGGIAQVLPLPCPFPARRVRRTALFCPARFDGRFFTGVTSCLRLWRAQKGAHEMFHCRHEGPLGPMTLLATPEAVAGVLFDGQKHAEAHQSGAGEPFEAPVLTLLRRELDLYFAGRLARFTVPLAPQGAPFHAAVWRALLDIPFGETVSYGALAAHLGSPGAARAVGAAVGRNPIAIAIPCHRVVGAGGQLTGYAGGLDRKRALLALEGGALFAAA
jgi:methylated-DNA-[protein]-cysteine S-methyltransferase